MQSPIDKSRLGIESDAKNALARASLALGTPELIAASDTVPTRLDRQLDVLASAPAGGGGAAAPGPFQIIDASTSGGSPTANITVNYGVFYSPGLGQMIDVTLGGVSLTLGPTLNFSGAGTYKIYLDTDLATYCVVQNTTGTMPTDNPGLSGAPETYMLLGLVTVGAVSGGFAVTAIQQGIANSLMAILCASAANFMWSPL